MYELESSLWKISQISFETFKSTVDSLLLKRVPIKIDMSGQIKFYL